jgi:hypothetical protein
MNLNPAAVLDPVFQFLDKIIAEFGVYLFLVLVWLFLLMLVWVFNGGLRRKFPNQPHVGAGIGIIISAPDRSVRFRFQKHPSSAKGIQQG